VATDQGASGYQAELTMMLAAVALARKQPVDVERSGSESVRSKSMVSTKCAEELRGTGVLEEVALVFAIDSPHEEPVKRMIPLSRHCNAILTDGKPAMNQSPMRSVRTWRRSVERLARNLMTRLQRPRHRSASMNSEHVRRDSQINEAAFHQV
jgi:hypothetical protein